MLQPLAAHHRRHASALGRQRAERPRRQAGCCERQRHSPSSAPLALSTCSCHACVCIGGDISVPGPGSTAWAAWCSSSPPTSRGAHIRKAAPPRMYARLRPSPCAGPTSLLATSVCTKAIAGAQGRGAGLAAQRVVQRSAPQSKCARRARRAVAAFPGDATAVLCSFGAALVSRGWSWARAGWGREQQAVQRSQRCCSASGRKSRPINTTKDPSPGRLKPCGRQIATNT